MHTASQGSIQMQEQHTCPPESGRPGPQAITQAKQQGGIRMNTWICTNLHQREFALAWVGHEHKHAHSCSIYHTIPAPHE